MNLDLHTGLLDQAEYLPSPNCDDREHEAIPEAVIIHCISLPPGEYGGDAVPRFFCNQLDAGEHPYYASMAHLTVSAHFYIRRGGEIVQFVPTHLRAWHAGESACLGRPKVNDFSLGIELEGLDTDPDGFTLDQYGSLSELVLVLQQAYPDITTNKLFAHSDIAPGRKPDPGPFFDWQQFLNKMDKMSI